MVYVDRNDLESVLPKHYAKYMLICDLATLLQTKQLAKLKSASYENRLQGCHLPLAN